MTFTVDPKSLGAMIGQAINLAFNEDLQWRLKKMEVHQMQVDLDYVEARARDIFQLNLKLQSEGQKFLSDKKTDKAKKEPLVKRKESKE